MFDAEILVGLGGLLLGGISIAVSIYSAKHRLPLYFIRTTSLVKVNHPDIEVVFKGKTIPNLYSVRFVFWNGGREEIRREDLPKGKASPAFRFSENTEILSLSAKTTTGDKSGKLKKEKDNSLILTFDYLNKGDAIIGEIICTTSDNRFPKVHISGFVKGASIRVGDVFNLNILDHIFSLVFAGIFAFLSSLAIKSVYDAFLVSNMFKLVISGMFSILCVGLFIIFLWANILSIPKKIPKQYDYFLNNGELP